METILNIYNTLVNHFTENTVEGGGLLYFTFIFGNLLMTLVAGSLCVITKRVQLIYDFFGFIMGSSLVATMASMVLLMPSFFFREAAKPMFYAGCIVTAASYGLILYYFSPLNSMGKTLSKKE